MAYDDIPAEFRPLDLSEGKTNSMGQSVIGGEAAITRADREFQEAETERNAEFSLYESSGASAVVDQFTSGGNYAYDLLESYKRAYDNPVDPTYDPNKWLQENRLKNDIDESYLPSFMGTGSANEANALVQGINSRKLAQKRIQKMGIAGQLASGMIAGMFDIDTVLSGGIGLYGKTGILATRAGRMMAGTAVGTTAAAIGATASPEDDWQNVAVAALFSAGLSSLGKDGKIDPLHTEINAGIKTAQVDLDEAIKRAWDEPISFRPDQGTGRPSFAPDPELVPEVVAKPAAKPTGEAAEAVERNPTTFDPSKVTMDVQDDVWEAGQRSGDAGSIGARQLTQTQADFVLPSPTIQSIQDTARTFVRTNDLDNKYFYDFNKATGTVARAVGDGVRKVIDTLSTAHIATDFDRIFKTGTATGKMFAHEFLSDGSGRINNVRSAAHLKSDWLDQLRAEWYTPYNEARNSYLKKQNISMFDFKGQMRAAEEFNKRVMLAQEELRLTGRYQTTDPEVLAAAAGVDNWAKLDVKIGRGNGASTAIPGYETMKEQPGYIMRKVTSSKMAAAIRNGGKSKDIENMWTEFYAHGATGNALPMDVSRKIAKMVMARSATKDRGADMSLYGLLQTDGAEFLEQALKNNGLTPSEAASVMRSLVSDAAERGKQGHVRGRLEGDLRFTASNGLKVIDFVETDLEKMLNYRSTNTAGRAAAAAKGIRTQQDANNLIEAMLDEMQRSIDNPITLKDAMQGPDKLAGAQSFANDFLDKDRKVSREYIEGIMSQFMGGGVLTEGNAALVSRMKRATVLATMNGLGLTQLAETGALMGAVGWREFVKQLPAAIKSDLTNPRSALIQELQSMGKLIPEERLYNPRYMAELDQSLHAQTEQMQLLDMIMGKGLQVQGIISGMNKVRYAQQKMAMMVTIDKLMQAMAGKVPDAVSAERLATIGIDQAMITKLKGVVQHVKFDGTNVSTLNTHLWGDQDLVEDFGRAMGIATDQLVQKARIGESNSFFAGNGLASLYTQFLSYPLTAITKQAARNAYIGDTEALYQAMYGFMMAGMVGMAKSTIAGRYEDLNPVTFAKQGFVQANLTGWVPLVSDPLMTLLGVDSLKFNPHGEIVRTPPTVDVVNRMLKAPGSLAGIITGDTSKENIRNLRYLPLIGNWYGMTAIANRL